MADKARYPQIPSTVWWGVRSILNRTPSVTVDERLLGVQLGVQEAAAKAYITELKSAGLLTEDNKASKLAQKWRLDDTYPEAVEELLASVYPEGLLHVAPPNSADRQKVVSWFMREGLGKGAAGNKAATYLLIASPTPNDATTRPAKAQGASGENASRKTPRGVSADRSGTSEVSRSSNRPKNENGNNVRKPGSLEAFPLNVNVQIHISADAGSEQIESIFSAMRRYLYDSSDS